MKLNQFEGPFDLLVYLIESAEMSIYDIRVSEIVDQYLAYLDEMKRAEIAVTTEFMVLAATLIEIKSKMLLPRVASDGSDVSAEDPRTELVSRLIEYKRFKNASLMLAESEELMQRVYTKPKEDISEYTENPDEYLKMDISEFVRAFNLFLYRKKKLEDVKKHYARVERRRMSLEQKISYIKTYLTGSADDCVMFSELVSGDSSLENEVATFTSLLEMAKSKAVTLNQEKNFDPIEIGRGETLETLDVSALAAEEVSASMEGNGSDK